MKLRHTAGLLVATLGILAGVLAAPAAADTTDVADTVDDVLSALDGLGNGNLSPVDAGEVSRALCPVLADRGQDAVDIAAKVADGIGRPLGVGTMFTGTAISFLCPRAVDNVADTLNDGTPLLPIFG